MVAGLMTLGSTLGGPGNEATRGFALLISSFGALMVAVPLYVDARRLQAECRAAENIQTGKRNLSPCAVCGAPAANLWCTTHTQRICPDCLSRHDDPVRCLYKSLRRGPVPVTNPSRAATRA
jgi:hypothetical protein